MSTKHTPAVDAFFRNDSVLHAREIRQLQNAHNVNLHANTAAEEDELIDFDPNDDCSELEECEAHEYFERLDVFS